MDSLALHPIFSSTSVAFLLWTAAAAVFFFLIRKDPAFPPKRRTVLWGLRVLLLLIFALLLFRPSLLREVTVRLPASAAVLLDTSESMSITDQTGRARYDAVNEALGEARRGGDDSLFALFRFDEKTTSLEPDEALPAKPTGKETAIGAAIKDVLDRYAGKRLLGILLVSDGAQRTAASLAPQAAALAARAAGGDRQAYGELVRRHGSAVRGLLRRLGADSAAADDLAQDAFLTGFEQCAEFRGEGTFGGWIKKIAARLYLKKVKREARLIFSDAVEPVETMGRTDAARSLPIPRHGTKRPGRSASISCSPATPPSAMRATAGR